MKGQFPVSMLMSTAELVVSEPNELLRTAWERMRSAGIQHLPVLRGDELVGLLSSWDVANVAVEQGAEAFDRIRVGDVMQKALFQLDPRDTAQRAAELLIGGDIHSLPVLDEEDNLIGIVTSSDLLRHFAGASHPREP